MGVVGLVGCCSRCEVESLVECMVLERFSEAFKSLGVPSRKSFVVWLTKDLRGESRGRVMLSHVWS